VRWRQSAPEIRSLSLFANRVQNALLLGVTCGVVIWVKGLERQRRKTHIALDERLPMAKVEIKEMHSIAHPMEEEK
jgi:hypothetical protein